MQGRRFLHRSFFADLSLGYTASDNFIGDAGVLF
jgi:hypothetical protein